MLNLLAGDKIKLVKSPKIWIGLFIVVIWPIYQLLSAMSHKEKLSQTMDTVINGATGVLMNVKSGLLILLIFCAFISFYIGEEFQNGTIRNVLSLGVSRSKFYLLKLLVSGCLTLGVTVIITAISTLGYGFLFGFGKISGVTNYNSYFWSLSLTIFLLIFSVVSVYVTINFLTRSVGSGLILTFIFTIMMGFLPGAFLKFKATKGITWWFSESFIFYKDFATPSTVKEFPQMILVSVITIIISTAIGMWSFYKMDIK